MRTLKLIYRSEQELQAYLSEHRLNIEFLGIPQLCKSKEKSTLAVKVHRIQFDEKSEKSTETIVREHIKLSNQKYDEIYSRYEQAL
jgi:hypothetical protein